MMEIIEGLPRNVVGIAVTGRVTMQDCHDVLLPAMEKSLKKHEKIRLYYELGSRFPGAGWDDLELGIESASRCERVAIVTDIGWVRLTAKALRFLIPGKIRVFATVDADEGRAWITARPGSRADTEITEPTRRPLLQPRRMRRSPARPLRVRGRAAAPRAASRRERGELTPLAQVDHAPPI
jgi:SpoIIAA-like